MANVREFVKMEGVDWNTRDNRGKSLLEMAREEKRQEVLEFLEKREREQRQAVRAREEAAGKEERPAQRPKVEEEEDVALTQLEVSAEQMAKERSTIKTKIVRLKNEKEKFENLLFQKTNELKAETEKLVNIDHKIKKRKEKFLKLAGSPAIVPECPVCLETMTAETQILSCKNSHIICWTCKPRVRTCVTCRSSKYIYRNPALEQMVRRALLKED